MDMQDNSQVGGLATEESSGPNPTTGNNQATGNDQAPAQNAGQSPEVQSYSKLRSDHQSALGRLRAMQQEQTAYQQREAEYKARLEKLEKSSMPEHSRKPNWDEMSREEIIQNLTEAGATEGEKRAWARFEKYMQEQEQKTQAEIRKAEIAKEEERFQKSWDEVFTADPEVDVSAVEKFMQEERIFNPKLAYIVMNQDLIKQEVATRTAKETVDKVAKNHKTATEGAGKAGIVPPVKQPARNGKERLSRIHQQLDEGIQSGNIDLTRF